MPILRPLAQRKPNKPRPRPNNPRPNRPPPTALPFDLGAAQRRRSLLQGRQSYLSNYRRGVTDLNRDVTNQVRAINQEAPNIYRGVLNNFAGRGMAYSSGYGHTFGIAANQIANERANLQSGREIDLSRMREDKENVMARYQYNLSNILQQQAQGQERNAGQLGFNRSNPPKKKKIKKKPRNRMMAPGVGGRF